MCMRICGPGISCLTNYLRRWKAEGEREKVRDKERVKERKGSKERGKVKKKEARERLMKSSY